MNSKLALSTPDPAIPSTNPTIQSDVALAAFALLEKLDSGRPSPPPSISRVFRLYCIEDLTALEIARRCRCCRHAVARRLSLIRRKTGLPPRLLRKQFNHVATHHIPLL